MLKIDSYLQRCVIEINKGSNPFLFLYKIIGDLATTNKRQIMRITLYYIKLCNQRQYWGTQREYMGSSSFTSGVHNYVISINEL